jgi:hypothetical protein
MAGEAVIAIEWIQAAIFDPGYNLRRDGKPV